MGKGLDVCQSIDKKKRVLSASVYDARVYHLIYGDSFLSFSKGMFKTQIFFWFSSLGDEHVASRICGIIMRRSFVSKEDRYALIRKG